MADDKKNDQKSDLDKALAKALEEGIAKGIAMATQMMQPSKPTGPTGPAANERCSACGQLLRACKDKHRQMAVYPESAKHGRWFQGVIINGVRYLSNSKQHKITVPAECDIEHLVQTWEQNEDELSTGRVVEHDSGHLGKGGTVIPATVGWR